MQTLHPLTRSLRLNDKILKKKQKHRKFQCQPEPMSWETKITHQPVISKRPVTTRHRKRASRESENRGRDPLGLLHHQQLLWNNDKVFL